MPGNIVLSDGTSNRTLVHVRTDGDRLFFEEQSGPLVGRMRLESRLFQNGAGTVNRVALKLSVGNVASSTIDGLPEVRYTDVWSQDVSVFRRGETPDRAKLHALVESLTGTSFVENLVVNGASA